MSTPIRHLLVFDASLADDPYLCWLYAAGFATTANVDRATAGFLPLFRYVGPHPDRAGLHLMTCPKVRGHQQDSTIWTKLRLAEHPRVALTSLNKEKLGLLQIVHETGADLESIVLFGRGPADVVELAKLTHVGSRAIVPPTVAVVQRPGMTAIIAEGLRHLGIPIYQDVGFRQQDDAGPDIGGLEAFSFWSESEYPFPPQRGTEADWSHILSTASARPRAPVVLFLRPDWPNCGSFTTFKNIALRYAERGTVIIDIAINENKTKYTSADVSDRLWDARRDLSPAFAYTAARSRSLFAKWRQSATRPSGLVAEHVHRYAAAAAPAWLRKLVRRSRPDYAYVHHYFTLDYLRKLQLDVPVVLDTHDLQSVNYVHHKYRSKSLKQSELFSDLLEQEMSFFRRANAVAFVNAEELALVASRMPEMDLFQFIAIPKITPSPSKKKDSESGPPRVLIVASRNPGNESNMIWFLDNIWPRVRGTSAILDVVGTISSYFEGKPVPEGCTLHGVAPSLSAFYEKADAVALPIVTGAGVAIKTIEALLHDRPICGTTHAFRGLGRPVRALFPKLDDPAAFADDLRLLIENPAAAQRRLEACRAAAKELAPKRFDDAFDRRHWAMLAVAAKRAE
jgi:hypothetical protein